MSSAAALVARYLAERGPDWSPDTRRGARHQLAILLRLLGSGVVDEASIVTCAAAVGEGRTRQGRPWSAAHRSTLLRTLRGLLRWAYRAGETLQDLSALFRVPRYERLPRTLSVAQVEALLGAARTAQERALVELLYGTGLRAGELARLRLGDVDLASCVLHVLRGKGGKGRLVPFGDVLRDALRAHLRERERSPRDELFLSVLGRPLTRDSLGGVMRALGCRAGLVAAQAHRLRHSYATHLLRGGASVRHVQVLLGHSSVASTAIYTEVDVGDLAAMLARCHPRERGSRL